MLTLLVGDQLWKLGQNHIGIRLFRSSRLETFPRQVEGAFQLVVYNNHKIIQTGEDVDTLKKLEARILADFKDGLPPHLQPNAKNPKYEPGSGQSRIFVASHSEFSSLHAREIQRILRDRAILVHGNTFDYDYGWDLESFGRLYDVDKKAYVQGEIGTHPPLLMFCLKLV